MMYTHIQKIREITRFNDIKSKDQLWMKILGATRSFPYTHPSCVHQNLPDILAKSLEREYKDLNLFCIVQTEKEVGRDNRGEVAHPLFLRTGPLWTGLRIRSPPQTSLSTAYSSKEHNVTYCWGFVPPKLFRSALNLGSPLSYVRMSIGRPSLQQ